MSTRSKIIALMFFGLMAACTAGNKIETGQTQTGGKQLSPGDLLSAIEKKLDTDSVFHVCAVPDNGGKCSVLVSSPFYMIGIEKANGGTVGRYRYKDCGNDASHCFNINAPYYTNRSEDSSNLDSRLHDIKSHFVSHILRFDPTPGNQASAVSERQFIYNVYANPNVSTDKSDLVEESWRALEGDFASDLLKQIEQAHATHILVYSTGWRTPQEEAVGDYQKWFEELAHAQTAAKQECAQKTKVDGCDSRFSPIYIGMSWPSVWPQLSEKGSYCNKAHDADEIGYTWANVLINKVLKSVAQQQNVKVVIVGHSFGARLLSRAVNSAPLLSSTTTDVPVDLFIGLQGAFPYKRFLTGVDVNKPDMIYKAAGCVAMGNEGGPYGDFALRARKFLFTNSSHDDAVDGTPEDIFIGDDRAYEETQMAPANRVFEHLVLQTDGSLNQLPSMDGRKVAMVNASDVVKNTVVKKSGPCTNASPCGPHNDVFNPASGRFTWDAISRYAPVSH